MSSISRSRWRAVVSQQLDAVRAYVQGQGLGPRYDSIVAATDAVVRQELAHLEIGYRVGKLQRILGPVASDPHLRLDVAVALRALEIVG